MNRRATRLWLLTFLLLVGLLLWLASRAGGFLIVDEPRKSDVILVLAGETSRRPQRALELLQQGYARRLVLDVPAGAQIYDLTQMQLAQNYIQRLPQADQISICPIVGLSTRDEARDAEKCLARDQARRVLIVTSDFHTRRALSIFRREAPRFEYSVAAARDDAQFGPRWWTHRQWAKTFFDEWLRLTWWKAVDQRR